MDNPMQPDRARQGWRVEPPRNHVHLLRPQGDP